MSLTRQQDGRTIIAPPHTPRAHGRLARIAAATRTAAQLQDDCARLTLAMLDAALARRARDTKALRNARQRVARARSALCLAPEGREEARRIGVALQGGGSAVAAVERAHADGREYAVRAAVRLVAVIREHRVETSSGLVHAGAAARWDALAELLEERALSVDPNVLTATQAFSKAKGDSRMSIGLGSFGSLLDLAAKARGVARAELLTCLELEARSRADRPPEVDATVRARAAELMEQRRRQREEAEGNHDDGSGGGSGGGLPDSGGVLVLPPPAGPASTAAVADPEPGFREGGRS